MFRSQILALNGSNSNSNISTGLKGLVRKPLQNKFKPQSPEKGPKPIWKPITEAHASGKFNSNNGFGGESRELFKKKLDQENLVQCNDPGISLEDVNAYIKIMSNAKIQPIEKNQTLTDANSLRYAKDNLLGLDAGSTENKKGSGSLFRSRVVSESNNEVSFHRPQNSKIQTRTTDVSATVASTKATEFSRPKRKVSSPSLVSSSPNKKSRIVHNNNNVKNYGQTFGKGYQLSENEKTRLCRKIRRFYCPQDLYPTEPEKEKPAKEKPVRTKAPTMEEMEEMANVPQNSPLWMKLRDPQWGMSILSTLVGWCSHRRRTTQWEIDSGLMPEPIHAMDDHKFTVYGHWGEYEATDVYKILMGCKSSVEYGMSIHDDYMLWHCSPDRLVELPENVCHNENTKFDSLSYVLEAKSPYYCVHKRKKYVPGIPPQIVPVDYVFQIQGQITVMRKLQHLAKAKHADLVSHWHFKEEAPPLYLGDGKFLVAETMITRMYRNPDFVKQLYDMTVEYANYVINKERPPDIYQPKFPRVDILPLKSAKFILTVPKDENGNCIYGPLDSCTNEPSAPFDENGEIIGDIDVDIQDYYDAPIQNISLEELLIA